MLSSQQPARTTSQRSNSYGSSKPAAAPQSSNRSDERYSSQDASKPQRMSSSASYEDQRRQGRSSSGYNDDGYGNASAARHNSYSSSGAGGRTAQGGGGRPVPSSTQGGGNRDRDALWPMFRAVDKGRRSFEISLEGLEEVDGLCANKALLTVGTGHLSEQELGAALVNGDYTSFDPHTVKMMIRCVWQQHNFGLSNFFRWAKFETESWF